MVDIIAVAEEIVKEIKKEVVRIGLIDSGDYLSSIGYRISGNHITLFSSVEYAEALEYGTYDLGALTRENFPKTASDARAMKKKEMSAKAAAGLPKGMVAFAPFRRVVYNDKLINEIILRNA